MSLESNEYLLTSAMLPSLELYSSPNMCVKSYGTFSSPVSCTTELRMSTDNWSIIC